MIKRREERGGAEFKGAAGEERNNYGVLKKRKKYIKGQKICER